MRLILLSLAALLTTAAPALAGTGDYGHDTSFTGEGSQGIAGRTTRATANQALALAPVILGTIAGGGGRLPPTSLDSFVYNAGGAAEQIYGDEGAAGLPPYFGFTQGHRIRAGINSSKLTTNHGSYLPNAWGGDEWTGPEFSQSGPSAPPPMPFYMPPQNQSNLVPPGSFPFDLNGIQAPPMGNVMLGVNSNPGGNGGGIGPGF